MACGFDPLVHHGLPRCYLGFRSARVRKWEYDGHDYVIFPSGSNLLYYGFRPLTYLDARLTGMRFHIGPHRQEETD